MAFVRCRKCRGGTPTGERPPLGPRPHPEGCGRKATRLSASRRPDLFGHDPEKWNPVFRKDHAPLQAERDLEATGIHHRRLMTGSGSASCASYWQNSDAAASRERSSMSSLRGAKRRSNPEPCRQLDCFAPLAMTSVLPRLPAPSSRPSPRTRGEGADPRRENDFPRTVSTSSLSSTIHGPTITASRRRRSHRPCPRS